MRVAHGMRARVMQLLCGVDVAKVCGYAPFARADMRRRAGIRTDTDTPMDNGCAVGMRVWLDSQICARARPDLRCWSLYAVGWYGCAHARDMRARASDVCGLYMRWCVCARFAV